jgi:queuine tRNA-ribosyltransferase
VTHHVAFVADAVDGDARAGVAYFADGRTYRTPCFMPVGTRGAVKYLSADDYVALGAQIVLANTYHLMLRPGVDVVAELGGLARFTGWDGLTLTDSGGYQVFSLDPAVDDDGVTFRSVYDGSSHRFTPERAVEVQEQLGASIAMVLDVCPPLPSTPDVIRQAVERTSAWAERARRHHRHAGQAQFGIVQGGVDEALRADSAKRTVAIGFDGYGVGGLSVGESRAEMLPALAAALSELPLDQPRYLMGVGDPARMVEAVALGVDQFRGQRVDQVLRIPNVESGRVNASELKYCDLPEDEASKYALHRGDLLFIRTNGVLDRLGSCAVYSGDPESALFASYLIRARLKPKVDPRYVAYFYASALGTSLVAGRSGEYSFDSVIPGH